jgi:hypothetical protein
VLVHRSAPESVRSWVARYHRWTLAQRVGMKPAYRAALLLNPVVAPLAAALLAGRAHPLAWAVLAGALALRVAAAAASARAAPAGGTPAWLRPLADVAHFAFCLAALLVPVVEWRGRRYRVDGRGRLVATLAAEATPAPVPLGLPRQDAALRPPDGATAA